MINAKTQRKQSNTRRVPIEALKSRKRGWKDGEALRRKKHYLGAASVVKNSSLTQKRKLTHFTEQETVSSGTSIPSALKSAGGAKFGNRGEEVNTAVRKDLRSDCRTLAMGGSDPRATSNGQGKRRASPGSVERARDEGIVSPVENVAASGIPVIQVGEDSVGKKGKRKLLGKRVWKPGNGKQEVADHAAPGKLVRKRKRRDLLDGIGPIELDTVNGEGAGPLTRHMAKTGLRIESSDVQVKRIKSSLIMGEEEEVPVTAEGNSSKVLVKDVVDADLNISASEKVRSGSKDEELPGRLDDVSDQSGLKGRSVPSGSAILLTTEVTASRNISRDEQSDKQSAPNLPKFVSPRITRGMKDRGLHDEDLAAEGKSRVRLPVTNEVQADLGVKDGRKSQGLDAQVCEGAVLITETEGDKDKDVLEVNDNLKSKGRVNEEGEHPDLRLAAEKGVKDALRIGEDLNSKVRVDQYVDQAAVSMAIHKVKSMKLRSLKVVGNLKGSEWPTKRPTKNRAKNAVDTSVKVMDKEFQVADKSTVKCSVLTASDVTSNFQANGTEIKAVNGTVNVSKAPIKRLKKKRYKNGVETLAKDTATTLGDGVKDKHTVEDVDCMTVGRTAVPGTADGALNASKWSSKQIEKKRNKNSVDTHAKDMDIKYGEETGVKCMVREVEGVPAGGAATSKDQVTSAGKERVDGAGDASHFSNKRLKKKQGKSNVNITTKGTALGTQINCLVTEVEGVPAGGAAASNNQVKRVGKKIVDGAGNASHLPSKRLKKQQGKNVVDITTKGTGLATGINCVVTEVEGVSAGGAAASNNQGKSAGKERVYGAGNASRLHSKRLKKQCGKDAVDITRKGTGLGTGINCVVTEVEGVPAGGAAASNNQGKSAGKERVDGAGIALHLHSKRPKKQHGKNVVDITTKGTALGAGVKCIAREVDGVPAGGAAASNNQVKSAGKERVDGAGNASHLSSKRLKKKQGKNVVDINRKGSALGTGDVVDKKCTLKGAETLTADVTVVSQRQVKDTGPGTEEGAVNGPNWPSKQMKRKRHKNAVDASAEDTNIRHDRGAVKRSTVKDASDGSASKNDLKSASYEIADEAAVNASERPMKRLKKQQEYSAVDEFAKGLSSHNGEGSGKRNMQIGRISTRSGRNVCQSELQRELKHGLHDPTRQHQSTEDRIEIKNALNEDAAPGNMSIKKKQGRKSCVVGRLKKIGMKFGSAALRKPSNLLKEKSVEDSPVDENFFEQARKLRTEENHQSVQMGASVQLNSDGTGSALRDQTSDECSPAKEKLKAGAGTTEEVMMHQYEGSNVVKKFVRCANRAVPVEGCQQIGHDEQVPEMLQAESQHGDCKNYETMSSNKSPVTEVDVDSHRSNVSVPTKETNTLRSSTRRVYTEVEKLLKGADGTWAITHGQGRRKRGACTQLASEAVVERSVTSPELESCALKPSVIKDNAGEPIQMVDNDSPVHVERSSENVVEIPGRSVKKGISLRATNDINQEKSSRMNPAVKGRKRGKCLNVSSISDGLGGCKSQLTPGVKVLSLNKGAGASDTEPGGNSGGGILGEDSVEVILDTLQGATEGLSQSKGSRELGQGALLRKKVLRKNMRSRVNHTMQTRARHSQQPSTYNTELQACVDMEESLVMTEQVETGFNELQAAKVDKLGVQGPSTSGVETSKRRKLKTSFEKVSVVSQMKKHTGRRSDVMSVTHPTAELQSESLEVEFNKREAYKKSTSRTEKLFQRRSKAVKAAVIFRRPPPKGPLDFEDGRQVFKSSRVGEDSLTAGVPGEIIVGQVDVEDLKQVPEIVPHLVGEALGTDTGVLNPDVLDSIPMASTTISHEEPLGVEGSRQDSQIVRSQTSEALRTVEEGTSSAMWYRNLSPEGPVDVQDMRQLPLTCPDSDAEALRTDGAGLNPDAVDSCAMHSTILLREELDEDSRGFPKSVPHPAAEVLICEDGLHLCPTRLPPEGPVDAEVIGEISQVVAHPPTVPLRAEDKNLCVEVVDSPGISSSGVSCKVPVHVDLFCQTVSKIAAKVVRTDEDRLNLKNSDSSIPFAQFPPSEGLVDEVYMRQVHEIGPPHSTVEELGSVDDQFIPKVSVCPAVCLDNSDLEHPFDRGDIGQMPAEVLSAAAEPLSVDDHFASVSPSNADGDGLSLGFSHGIPAVSKSPVEGPNDVDSVNEVCLKTHSVTLEPLCSAQDGLIPDLLQSPRINVGDVFAKHLESTKTAKKSTAIVAGLNKETVSDLMQSTMRTGHEVVNSQEEDQLNTIPPAGLVDTEVTDFGAHSEAILLKPPYKDMLEPVIKKAEVVALGSSKCSKILSDRIPFQTLLSQVILGTNAVYEGQSRSVFYGDKFSNWDGVKFGPIEGSSNVPKPVSSTNRLQSFGVSIDKMMEITSASSMKDHGNSSGCPNPLCEDDYHFQGHKLKDTTLLSTGVSCEQGLKDEGDFCHGSHPGFSALEVPRLDYKIQQHLEGDAADSGKVQGLASSRPSEYVVENDAANVLLIPQKICSDKSVGPNFEVPSSPQVGQLTPSMSSGCLQLQSTEKVSPLVLPNLREAEYCTSDQTLLPGSHGQVMQNDHLSHKTADNSVELLIDGSLNSLHSTADDLHLKDSPCVDAILDTSTGPGDTDISINILGSSQGVNAASETLMGALSSGLLSVEENQVAPDGLHGSSSRVQGMEEVDAKLNEPVNVESRENRSLRSALKPEQPSEDEVKVPELQEEEQPKQACHEQIEVTKQKEEEEEEEEEGLYQLVAEKEKDEQACDGLTEQHGIKAGIQMEFQEGKDEDQAIEACKEQLELQGIDKGQAIEACKEQMELQEGKDKDQAIEACKEQMELQEGKDKDQAIQACEGQKELDELKGEDQAMPASEGDTELPKVKDENQAVETCKEQMELQEGKDHDQAIVVRSLKELDEQKDEDQAIEVCGSPKELDNQKAEDQAIKACESLKVLDEQKDEDLAIEACKSMKELDEQKDEDQTIEACNRQMQLQAEEDQDQASEAFKRQMQLQEGKDQDQANEACKQQMQMQEEKDQDKAIEACKSQKELDVQKYEDPAIETCEGQLEVQEAKDEDEAIAACEVQLELQEEKDQDQAIEVCKDQKALDEQKDEDQVILASEGDLELQEGKYECHAMQGSEGQIESNGKKECNHKSQMERLQSLGAQTNMADGVKSVSASKKRKGRLAGDLTKESDLQLQRKAWEVREVGDKEEDGFRVYLQKRRFLLVSTPIEPGGMRIRPRPLDPDQALPIFWEGRDKEFYEYDGGSFYRWLQQQEEARLKRMASELGDGENNESIGSSTISKTNLIHKRPIFVPLFRKLPDYQQNDDSIREGYEQNSEQSKKFCVPVPHGYRRYTRPPARILGHGLGGSFSTVPSLYDMDNEDEEWLKGYVRRQNEAGTEEILSEDIFEELMELFERECVRIYDHSDKSFAAPSAEQFEKGGASGQRLKTVDMEAGQRSRFRLKMTRDYGGISPSQDTSEGSLLQKGGERQSGNLVQNAVEECCICNGGENSALNLVYRCKLCSITVHQSCYGVCEAVGNESGCHVPILNWCCRKCEAVVAGKTLPNVSCAICCKPGGAMKVTMDPLKWAHIACALYTNETFFVDPEAMEPIDGLVAVETRVKKQRERCGLCGVKEGSCVRCASRGCRAPFHISCGVNQGASFELRHAKQLVVGVRSFCPRHATFAPVRGPDENEWIQSSKVLGPVELLPAVSTESSDTLEMEQIRKRYVERDGKLGGHFGGEINNEASWQVEDPILNKCDTFSNKGISAVRRKRSGVTPKRLCLIGGLFDVSEKDGHQTDLCLPQALEEKLDPGSTATSGSSIHQPLNLANVDHAKVIIADEGRPGCAEPGGKKVPSEEKLMTQGVGSSACPDGAESDVVARYVDSCPTCPGLETLDTSLAPPHIVKAVYSYWQSKRAIADGSFLYEFKQLESARKRGIFNKVLGLSEESLPTSNGQDSPPLCPTTRRPRSSSRDPVLSKMLELRQQLEMLRSIASNVVRREQLKHDDQKLFYDSVQQQLLLAREKSKASHCHWCWNTHNLLSCTSCPKVFCFHCFKRRRGYGVKGWAAAWKLPQYVCNFCLGNTTPGTRPEIDSNLKRSTSSGPRDAPVLRTTGVLAQGSTVTPQRTSSAEQASLAEETIKKLDTVNGLHGSSSSQDTARIGAGETNSMTQATKLAEPSTFETSGTVNRVYTDGILPSIVQGTKDKEVEKHENESEAGKKLKRKAVKSWKKKKVVSQPEFVPRTTTRIKKLVRSPSFVYGSEDDTTVSESDESRVEKKTVKLSELKDTVAANPCTNSVPLSPGRATETGLHPLKFSLKWCSGVGKLILRRHGATEQTVVSTPED